MRQSIAEQAIREKLEVAVKNRSELKEGIKAYDIEVETLESTLRHMENLKALNGNGGDEEPDESANDSPDPDFDLKD